MGAVSKKISWSFFVHYCRMVLQTYSYLLEVRHRQLKACIESAYARQLHKVRNIANVTTQTQTVRYIYRHKLYLK